ncbi:MAG: hypothetical protein ACRC4M_05660 [Mycoplasma sp.]
MRSEIQKMQPNENVNLYLKSFVEKFEKKFGINLAGDDIKGEIFIGDKDYFLKKKVTTLDSFIFNINFYFDESEMEIEIPLLREFWKEEEKGTTTKEILDENEDKILDSIRNFILSARRKYWENEENKIHQLNLRDGKKYKNTLGNEIIFEVEKIHYKNEKTTEVLKEILEKIHNKLGFLVEKKEFLKSNIFIGPKKGEGNFIFKIKFEYDNVEHFVEIPLAKNWYDENLTDNGASKKLKEKEKEIIDEMVWKIIKNRIDFWCDKNNQIKEIDLRGNRAHNEKIRQQQKQKQQL